MHASYPHRIHTPYDITAPQNECTEIPILSWKKRNNDSACRLTKAIAVIGDAPKAIAVIGDAPTKMRKKHKKTSAKYPPKLIQIPPTIFHPTFANNY